MKKIIVFMLAVSLFASMLMGCAKTEQATPNTSAGLSADSSGVVATDGSTSMEKVIGYLSEVYMQDHNGTKITYNPTGSGSGIKAVQEGRCDIGLSSRNLKEEEKANLTQTVVAIDGIAMVVHPDNNIENLTMEQISSLYKGEIANWKEVGGSDAPVVLIGREAASGTRDGFESITKTEDMCKYAQELNSTGDVIQTVAQNPNAIGYASLASVKDSVKVLQVETVFPTKETIQDGSYKIQRNFVFVTPKSASLSSAAQAFFDYVTSGNADAVIEKAGAIPVSR